MWVTKLKESESVQECWITIVYTGDRGIDIYIYIPDVMWCKIKQLSVKMSYKKWTGIIFGGVLRDSLTPFTIKNEDTYFLRILSVLSNCAFLILWMKM